MAAAAASSSSSRVIDGRDVYTGQLEDHLIEHSQAELNARWNATRFDNENDDDDWGDELSRTGGRMTSNNIKKWKLTAKGPRTLDCKFLVIVVLRLPPFPFVFVCCVSDVMLVRCLSST